MRGAALLAAVVLCNISEAQPAIKAAREPVVDGKPISAWVAQLGKGDAASYAATRALTKAGPEARAAAPGLAKLLGAEGVLRYAVPIALVGIGPDAVPAVRKSLEAASPAVRARAAMVLGLLGPAARDAGPALVGLLGDRDANARRLVATALGEIGYGPGKASLQKALADKDKAVALEAAWSLAQLGDAAGAEVLATACGDEDPENVLRALAALAELGSKAKPKAGKALEAAARHKSPSVRLAAAVALFVVADRADEALAVVEAAMKDKESRAEAVAALGRLAGSASAGTRLAGLLDDPSPQVRRAAAAALCGDMGDPALVRKRLLARLRDPDAATRWWCAVALLGRAGGVKPHEEALMEALRLDLAMVKGEVLGGKRHELVGPALRRVIEARPGRFQAEAARAAGFAGAEARPAREALLKLCRDGDKTSRRAAAEALAALGLDGLPVLRKALGDASPTAREGAARALAFIGIPARQASKELAGLLGDAEQGVRTQAALALWRIEGDTEMPLRVLDLVIKDLDNPDRWEALEAVGVIASESSPPIRGLTEVLVNGLKDRDARMRATAAKWLWRRTRQGKNILPLLRDAAGSADEHARLVAVETLGELDAEAGPVPLLVAALEDRSLAVRLVAQEGLARVRDVAATAKALSAKGKASEGATRALGLMGPAARAALPALAKAGTPQARWALSLIFPEKDEELEAYLAAVAAGADAAKLARLARALEPK